MVSLVTSELKGDRETRGRVTHQEDVLESQVRLPVLLESIYTDLPVTRDIGMEDLGGEEGFGWRDREVLGE